MTNGNSRSKASDFDPELLGLFDKYVHGQIDRRGFLESAGRFAVGGLTAAGLLQALSPNFAMRRDAVIVAAGTPKNGAMTPCFRP